MLTLTRKTEYGLIAMCHLARVGEKVVSARDISEEHGVPLRLLMNVLKLLNRHGLVTSVRGARGGYALARSPDGITLTSLIEAIEGPVHLTRCTDPSPNGRKCGLTPTCTVRVALVDLHRRMKAFLSDVTLADLAFGEPHIAELDVLEAVVK